MPKKKYDESLLLDIYKYLEQNPYATYKEIEDNFCDYKINANSLVKRLQRMGCIRVDRHTDPNTGKIIGSVKTCLKEPLI